MMTFPGKSRDNDIERITAIYQAHRGDIVDYLKKFFVVWCNSKTKENQPYSRLNTGWLDWALGDEIPRNNGAHIPQYSEVA